eukprot:10519790-Ditylum_brightwellii.AAC.1
MEQTQLTEGKGKWFLLYKEQNACQVQNFVDKVLPRLYSDFVEPEHLIPGYKVPTCTSNLASNNISSYADTLQKRYGNNTHNSSAIASAERPRKRTMIQIDNTNFPPLPSTEHQTHNNNAIQNTKNTDMVSLATSIPQLNAGATYTTMSENTTKEMNERFQGDIKKLKETQEIKLQELELKLYLEIEQTVTNQMEHHSTTTTNNLHSHLETVIDQKMGSFSVNIHTAMQQNTIQLQAQLNLGKQVTHNLREEFNQGMQKMMAILQVISMGGQQLQTSLSSAPLPMDEDGTLAE